MIDPNSPDPSKRKSFFDEEEQDHAEVTENHGSRSNQSSYNGGGRERMASGYYENEEEDTYHEDEYDRRKKSSLPFLQNLTSGENSSRRLAYAAGGIGGVLVLFVGGWMVFHNANQGIPVIDQPAMPAKEKVANTEGVETIGMGGIGDTSLDNAGKPTLAPGPEKANPTALAEQYNKPPPPVQTQPVAANNGAGGQQSAVGNSGQTTLVPDLAPLPGASSSQASTENNDNEEEAAPPVKKHHTPSKHQQVEHKEAKKAPVKKESQKEVKKTPQQETKKEPKRGVTTTGSGQYTVQLAALGSNSGAEKQWQVLRKKAPEILGGHSPTIQKAEVKGNTIYRLRVKGFASKAQANAFCNQLKAKNISCTYGNF